jgi:hypothetical protein
MTTGSVESISICVCFQFLGTEIMSVAGLYDVKKFSIFRFTLRQIVDDSRRSVLTGLEKP